jgi:hypothetical protein
MRKMRFINNLETTSLYMIQPRLKRHKRFPGTILCTPAPFPRDRPDLHRTLHCVSAFGRITFEHSHV